jgi:rhamnosyltransferase subunit B
VARNRYRAPRVASELKTLLESPSYRERAADVGRRIGEENGLRAACDRIEALLPAGRVATIADGKL